MRRVHCGYQDQVATAAEPKRPGRSSEGRDAPRTSGRRELLLSAVPELRRSFSERQLMIYSSGTAFHILSSTVPFLLFCLAAIGFLELQEVWTNDIGSHIKPHVSKAAYTVIDDTAQKVLGQKQIWWVTGGFALAI